jgi:hypothetical protein
MIIAIGKHRMQLIVPIFITSLYTFYQICSNVHVNKCTCKNIENVLIDPLLSDEVTQMFSG